MIAREHSINNIKKKKNLIKRSVDIILCSYFIEWTSNEWKFVSWKFQMYHYLFFFLVIVHINYRMYFVGPCPQLVFSILYIFTRLCDYNLAEYGIGRN